MEEKIIIEIQDKIPSSIEAKLKGIGNAAELSALRLERAKNATATSAERLIQAQRKSETEMQRLIRTTAQAESAVLRLKNAQDKLNNSASKYSGSKSSSGISSMVKGGLAALGLGMGINEIVDLSNEYTVLDNKIKVVTDSARQHDEVMNQVFEIANKTRTGVSDTATAFQRLDMALAPLGASQAETLRMTETINKAFIIGGASTEEAAGALRQLTQAFNAGKLAGDEYRSVSENAPIIMEALSKSLGKTKGELKTMSAQGEITSQVLRKALNEAIGSVDERFAKTNITLGQSVNILKNQLIEAIGLVENKTGVFSKIANVIVEFADNIIPLTQSVALTTDAVIDLAGALTDIGSEKTISGFVFLRRTIQGLAFMIYGLGDAIKFVKLISLDLAKITLGTFANVLKGLNAVNEAKIKVASFFGQSFQSEKDTKGTLEPYIEMLKLVNGELQNTSDSITDSEDAYTKWIKKIDEAENSTGGFTKTLDALRKARKDLEDEEKRRNAARNALKANPAKYKANDPLQALFDDKVIRKQADDINQIYKDYNAELANSIQLTKYYGPELENMTQLKQFEMKLAEKGMYLAPIEQQARLKEIEDLRQLNLLQQQRNSLYSQTIGQKEQIATMFTAVQAGVPGATTDELMMAGFGSQMEGTQTEYNNKLKQEADFRKQLKEMADKDSKYKKYLNEYDQKEDQKKFKAKMGYASDFFENMSSLQKSGSIELFRIGQAAAIAQATINSMLAITEVWAAKDIPVTAKGAVSAAISVAMAMQVANIASQEPGFKEGGYTGNMDVNKVAGVVHGKEFVSNAAATARNRSTLEAMNRGETIGNGVYLTIENYGTSKGFDVETEENRIRIIARDEVAKNTPDLVASEISNPNSRTSKALNRNTNVTRKR